MKRFSVIALIALVIVALAMPAAAFENIFGGYWRTRAFTQQQFSGDNRNESGDLSRVDTRTRLYYTAKLNDNLSFVNKFEFDAVWGDDNLGDIGADGKVFEIKNSYIDWKKGAIRATAGIQNFTANRTFSIADDASGVKLIYTLSDSIVMPFSWLRVEEGYENDQGIDDNKLNDGDVDHLTFSPLFKVGDNFRINPTIIYVTGQDARGLAKFAADLPAGFEFDNIDAIATTLNVDADLDFASIWFTGGFQSCSIKVTDGTASDDVDLSGYLIAMGADANLGPAAVHGQVFYASGDEDDDFDGGAWIAFPGASYYWSEIMGQGIFDNRPSNGSPGIKVSDIYAGNLGATLKPMDKLTVTMDVWYAALAEDNAAGDDKLGTEVDLKVTYKLVEGLNLDVVGAYLFADDATGDDDPIEVGTRLSISF